MRDHVQSGIPTVAAHGCFWLLALLFLLAAGPAHAGSVFKCVDARGAIAFQATPCAVDARQTAMEVQEQPLIDPNVPSFAPADCRSLLPHARMRALAAMHARNERLPDVRARTHKRSHTNAAPPTARCSIGIRVVRVRFRATASRDSEPISRTQIRTAADAVRAEAHGAPCGSPRKRFRATKPAARSTRPQPRVATGTRATNRCRRTSTIQAATPAVVFDRPQIVSAIRLREVVRFGEDARRVASTCGCLRNSSASCISHSRNAMKPACSRERCG